MEHRVSLTVGKDNYQLLSEEARRIKAKESKKENREGMEEIAKFITKNGSLADENRSW